MRSYFVKNLVKNTSKNTVKNSLSGRVAGFTLLEMLVVMVIIGLLAGLVGPRIFGKVDSSKVQTAQTQIKMLESALNIMRLDVGQVPPPEQGLQWLLTPPLDPNLQPLWKGPISKAPSLWILE
jgi:general secretion pathway protein G